MSRSRMIRSTNVARDRRWLARGATGLLLATVAAAVVAAAHSGDRPPATAVAHSALAPDGAFTTTAGREVTVSALRGQPTLLWFVDSSCSSCVAGTQALRGKIQRFAALHVRVVELQLDGFSPGGPGIREFVRLAGRAGANPSWTFGSASSTLTSEYDSQGYQDIYYMLDSSGRVTDVDSAPAAKMSDLLADAARVSPVSPRA